MGRRRSRTPRGRGGYQKWTEWISRHIANFGRHAAKRPKGLFVDSEGNMLLEQVMRLWGHQQELQDQDVLLAIREHMFHEDGTLRFSIDNDNQGRQKIRVLPKRDRWTSAGAQSAQSSNGVWVWVPEGNGSHVWVPEGNSWGSVTTPKKNAPRREGSAATQDLSTATKIDMPLESLIESEQEADHAAHLRAAFDQTVNLRKETWRRHTGKGSKGKGKGGRTGGKGSQASRKRNEPESKPSRHRRVGSRSPSREGSEDDELAQITQRALQVASPSAADGNAPHKKTPDPPPGPHWTKYVDDGMTWYCYEGPLGKFWCRSEDTQDIEPYEEDD